VRKVSKKHSESLKNLQFAQKRSTSKVGDKESMVEDIRAIKEKPSSLDWDSRKDGLRASWELTTPHSK
jgi:hypothetical protein